MEKKNSSQNGRLIIRNLKNAVMSMVAPLPCLLFYLSFLRHYNHHEGVSVNVQLWTWCYQHPLLLINILFFLNIDLLFWLLSFLFSSHWMIDLYWTVIPVTLVHYFATHPASQYEFWRSSVVVVLTWVWAIRLTHSYLRREKWQLGAREDWRFTDMSHQYGKHWWFISFFAVYLSQQVLLIGLCLPFYFIHSVQKPWNTWDFIALLFCLSGIIISYFADTQLHEFKTQNDKLRELGKPIDQPCLDKGLWYYSRHPNYFGEQLWWWGLVIFSANVGSFWSFIGAFINSACLSYVTILVENKILKQEYRSEAYRTYQKTTSVWIPWFKSSIDAGKDKMN